MQLNKYLSGLITSVFVIFAIIVKRRLSTPLRGVPGPWYAKITHLWLKKNVLDGRRMHYIHNLHKQYGPVVQIAPNEIDVCDPELYKQIHKIGSGFLKDPWYQSFRVGDTFDLFSFIDPKDHAARRKLFAPLWTNTALHTNWESSVVEKVKMAVASIKRDALAGEADVFKWWTFMTTDVISHLAFGESMHMLERQLRNQYIEDIEKAAKVSGLFSELPFLRTIAKALPFEAVQDLLGAEFRVQDYGQLAIQRAKAGGLRLVNVFSKFIAESEKESSLISDYEVAFEAGGFTVAGSGTTAVSLTYLVWAVLCHPDFQMKLEAEVNQLPPDISDSLLEKLPLLNAVIDETLRLYGAAPGSLPRQPPKGGAKLGNYFVPEGTTVSSQAYSLHRNEDVYHNCEKFDPNRFIAQDGTYEPPKTAFAPFGAGSRTCLGIHLAKMELRHGAFEFFRECRGARIASSMTPADMDMVNFFLVSPKGNKCCVTLNQEKANL